MTDAQPLVQDLLDEVPVAEVGHLEVEVQHIEQVDAEGLERAGLLVGGHQPERRFVGLEQPARMRVEGDHRQRRADGPGRRGRAGNHLLMPQVDAVEIAQRHGRAAVVVGQMFPAPDDAGALHAVGRRGTITVASPSNTVLPPTSQTVAKVAWPRLSSRAVTVTRVVTSSPNRTGRRKRSCWAR